MLSVEELRNQYESLVEREDHLLQQIQTGEICLFSLLETLYRKDNEMDLDTAKKLIQHRHGYIDEYRSVLWRVRMEKTILAVQLKPEAL